MLTGPLLRILLMGTLPALAAFSLAAAEVDPTQLPPPAGVQIDFSRDIKPVLQGTCLRCHGPEKPKSEFRLDNRAAALKGGDIGVDILPGDSGKSRLIHFIAGLVPDKEMPPEGRGEPLTPEQVGLFRAWIDQGVQWENVAPTNVLDVTVSTTFGGTVVSGDAKKFRENYWTENGLNGGLERFELFSQPSSETRITSSGHVLLNDYAISLGADRNGLGFIHSGWEQYRKYYDSYGGYFASPRPRLPQYLDEDLYLDNGKAWIDFGLTLPHWPKIVLGYEYDYRRGNEAITSWSSDSFPGDPRNLAPASKHLDESTHLIKFDFDAEVKGFTIQDEFRGAFYTSTSGYTNVAARGSMSQNANSATRYLEGANSIRLERRFKDWFFASGGYFYSSLNSDDSFTDLTVNNRTLFLASMPLIELSRETHVFNLNGLAGPFDGLTLFAGVQSEWTREHSLGSGSLNGIAYSLPPAINLAVNPTTVAADRDQNTVSEQVGLRYTKIPFTALFADARLQQETIAGTDSAIQPGNSFLENPSYRSYLMDFRAGFNTSPWQNVSFSAHYRRYENDSHYNTNSPPIPSGGYPGFISRRDLVTDEIEAKLVLRPANWLKTTLSYQYVTTDYREDTRTAFDPGIVYSPAGELVAGRYDSHIYSLGLTITPQRRLTLSGTFSFEDSRIVTPNSHLVPPYEGNVYSALASATYLIDQATDLSANYGFSLADYSSHSGTGSILSPPPLGIKYRQQGLQVALSHRFNKSVSTRVQYGYYDYDEPSAAGVKNYSAHSVFATLTYRFH